MKRIKWLRTLGLSAAAFAGIIPVAAMTTSCAVTKIQIDRFTYASLKAAVDAGKDKFTDFTSTNFTFQDLLIGHKSITGGNYMLIIGSNQMPSTCKFFTKDSNVRRRSDWINSYFNDSILHDAVSLDPKADKVKKEFTIFNIVDYSPTSYYDSKGNRLYLSTDGESPNLTYVNPYAKWTDPLVKSTYKFNSVNRSAQLGGLYEWDKDSVKVDKDYIRNDASAVAYRTFNDLGAKLWPVDEKATPARKKTFNTAETDGSRLIVFKDGTLNYIDDLPTSGESFANVINDNFIKDEEEKKS